MNKLASLSVGSLRLSSQFKPFNSCESVLFPAVNRFYSSDNDSDDPAVKAKEKLNSLLQDLAVSGNDQRNFVEPKLAKPRPSKPLKRGKDGMPKSQTPSTKDLESDVVTAAKEVASLSSKKVKTESELLLRLKQVSKESNDAKKENEVSGEDLESIFSGLRVDKPLSKQQQKVTKVLQNVEKQEKDLSMEQQAFLQKRARMRREKSVEKMSETSVDLNSGIPLGIFDGPMTQSADSHLLQKWRACNQRELDILSTPPPRNALEEMIVQTKQGKLWQFPIDNEQGLDYSEDPFYNHVFLEHNLEGWCPKSGPVRNFMETVCLGLSQNPYMSSHKKVDTILWFKDYFERPENNEILVHSGCWEEEESASN